ncbi:menaquinone-dependent protoporphyrinogen IX dehydrogenase [Vagococcus humatus]|uniref:Protoporphyrinogen IX dehydrogenase [quinone] n=1 Tax=Vagococcus humatus TaxID=1889241 RepID=A0A3S0AWJ0_9ENTE|nr:menaquinone-dependent protoporphyrinogen IX dehydrogenase [Vagococcus humatus]RST88780.1 menaquinone-dependent protoporphyrinogen IX dehydrogenase [Vagococcus humatus]
MTTYLILYTTVDGQTKKIAQFLAEKLAGKVTCQPLEEDIELQSFDKIIIGSSIRYGHFPKKLYRFVKKHQSILEEKQADFFGVNLIARSPEKQKVENNVYVRKFLEKVTWQPKNVYIFAGALLYTKYRFFDRKMIQFIMKLTEGPTDPQVDSEFTDWKQVTSYANQLNHEK